MTDLATHLSSLAVTVDALGLVRADIVGVQINAWESHITLHLKAASAARLVDADGNPVTHTVLEHTAQDGSVSYHHRAMIAGTNVQVLWLTHDTVSAEAA